MKAQRLEEKRYQTTTARSSSLCPITPTETIELGQHLAQIFRMFAAQISFLQFASTTPYPPLRRWSIDNCVLIQDLILSWHYETSRSNHTIRGYSQRMMHTCAS